MHGLRTGELFWDAYYFLRYTLLSATADVEPINYYARDRWPQHEFSCGTLTVATYQKAGSNRVVDSKTNAAAWKFADSAEKSPAVSV